MIPFTLKTITPVLNAKHIGSDRTIMSVTTDSRAPNISEKSLFVALKGPKFDAHNFAQEACNAGAVALLVDRPLPLDIPQMIVTDTRHGLGLLGAWVRQKSPARVVALTGSAGKTSVKEMTAAILRQCGRVSATDGNCNNEIGVPLTLLRLTSEHNFAVIELGASHLGEIAWTTNLVRPETVLVNNLSAAHLTGFRSLSGVAKGKGEIFAGLPTNGRAILNADSHDWKHWRRTLNQKKVWRFSIKQASKVDFFSSNAISDHQGVRFTLHSPQGECTIRIPLSGQHNIANALAAAALALSVGASLGAISSGLAQFKGIPGRLFPIMLGKGQLLLDDSYNANIASMAAAVQMLASMPGYRVMVLGDISDLGDAAAEYHRQVGKIISISKIDQVLSVGKLSHLISKTSGRGEHFENKSLLTLRLVQLLSKKVPTTVLVKGSRSSAMEQVVHTLQEKAPC